MPRYEDSMNTATPLRSHASSRAETSTIECFNPATGAPLGKVSACSAIQVQEAVERARNAQQTWRKSSFRQRRAVLQHILDHVLEHADELCEHIVKDSGKTYENALLGEIMPICNKIRWLQKNGEKHLRSEKMPSGLLMHKRARIEYIPLGVVACIVPWNYPLQNIISSLIAPLMAGNAVIVKVSEVVAWSSQRFQEITDEALRREGFSTDTVQIINGYGDTGAALVRAGVQKILFIGSAANGRRIIEGSAEHLTPVVMELGGKDPMIVCEDADVEKAVHSVLGGIYINLGQNCIASERLIIVDSMYDRIMDSLLPKVKALRQGAPVRGGQVDVGAITSPQQIRIIDTLVRDAVEKGATLLAGGIPIESNGGSFYPPTVLTGITAEMRIAQEEIFGPVLLVFRVKSEAEAVALANDTAFGLHASVITQDHEKGRKIAAQLDAGATCINDFGLCYLNQDLPFGGVKHSGFGVMNGRDGLRSYTTAKAVLEDRWKFSPPPVLYPVKPMDYEKSLAVIRLLFGAGARNKLQSLLTLVKLSMFKLSLFKTATSKLSKTRP
ncbi:Aldehyde dehydrogenase [gamma proteobacterium HdN1]|nr:Aldehyde dehydrogenase [gamma proteobacterium HdN1]